MIQELIYTSARRGLKPGTRGFCTVAHTAGMSPGVIRMLESLSAWPETAGKRIFGDQPAQPTISHCRFQWGGDFFTVLTKIQAVTSEPSRRDNKLVHHLVFPPTDRPSCGPARLAAAPIFYSNWNREPELLKPREDIKNIAATQEKRGGPNLFAENWAELTGDPGWAGVLCQRHKTNPNRPVYLMYPPEIEVLPLIIETLDLLPENKKWGITFSTSFSAVPAGVSCFLRCLSADNQVKKKTVRNANGSDFKLDLTRPLNRAPDNPDTAIARGEITDSETIDHLAPNPSASKRSSNQAGDTVRIDRS